MAYETMLLTELYKGCCYAYRKLVNCYKTLAGQETLSGPVHDLDKIDTSKIELRSLPLAIVVWAAQCVGIVMAISFVLGVVLWFTLVAFALLPGWFWACVICGSILFNKTTVPYNL